MRIDFSFNTLAVTITCTAILLLVSFSMVLMPPSVDSMVRGPVRVPSDEITWQNYRDYVVDVDFVNSTHIFNSIYAVLRQGPADIHPLGVSYFPAVIPKGTLLYRAGKKEVPGSFEWLAMDHEFSYSFGSRYSSYGRKSLKIRSRKPSSKTGAGAGLGAGNSPTGGPSPNGPSALKAATHMMTFRATRDMNKFIYLDGASAAKSTTGEMDTQELLYNVLRKKFEEANPGQNKMPERDFAEYICKWGKPLGLDGLIRVEIGFEIVLCDFQKDNIELVSNIPLRNPATELGLPSPSVISVENGWPVENNQLLEDKLTDEQKKILEKEYYWQSILDNYSLARQYNWLQAGNAHDQGDKRIKIDYRHFVTGINRIPMDVNPMKRRLLNEHMTFELQSDIVNDLEEILKNDFDYTKSNDWQEIFDEFITKFSPMLKTIQKILHSDERTPEQIAVDVTKYTLNFVLRFTPSDKNLAELGYDRDFATYQYARPPTDLVTESDFLIWSAYVNIVDYVIEKIYDVNNKLMPIVKAAAQDDNSINGQETSIISSCREAIDELIGNLNWISLHYKCEESCDWDEICFTPSWGPGPLAGGFKGHQDTTTVGFGKHFDDASGRQVINYNLQCINIDTLLQQPH
ncbi:hypothetical protein TPHA_0J02300 [Tetrapisispora phaffii CBS 4417]|uniref:Uncharacterized protein n=1 Tax=Tetrapisispora phaffii (strain ATCC 24235 / CBS 4417 / NBRC 1672 / NRRL Y-8282 / UCD 70-5) TaxID=1071381 RepID=G8BYV8_TETPH|nr:hypothetical protein TPHA_0J02300 [Tetrapisispora phaffii CBS 4417]CCE65050.1 hypothetical protein TPHA_0J02300 [Tetrapisispora phaffii CBS 4417]